MKKRPIKTIPSIVGLLILSTVVLGGVYLTQNLKTSRQTSAQARPLSVRIANITDQGATIYWFTQTPVPGSIKINNRVFLDRRDKNSGQTGHYLTHFVDIDQLESEKNYHFTILSQGQQYQETAFSFTTARALPPANRTADLAFGVVLNRQGQPLPETLITLSLAGASNLASLTDKNGFWSIPLSIAYQKDLSGLVNYDQDRQIVEILAEFEPGETATVITNTGNDHPVPPIMIGKTYDFSQNSPAPKQEPQDFDWSNPETVNEISVGNNFDSLSPTKINISQEKPMIDISNPQEGETIFITKPEFSGQGPANQKIKITLESPKKFEEELLVSSFGSWQWTPPENLTPGQHNITIEYYDENNLLHTVTRSFLVQAASASPSPTPITPLPTQPAQNQPTPTSTPIITPAVTQETPTTTTPTKQPTITATTITPKATGPEEIVSGNLTPLVILAILGLGLVYFAINSYQKKLP
ncbi:MAG: Ig-like domain-containing protein [Candidatus Shapirobacteria bacterium]|nr:Ig-like domain-containing protein [Candidatus Shapirobacteria bacterium]